MTVLLGIGVIALAVGFWLLVGFALQWLWNAVKVTCYTDSGGGDSDGGRDDTQDAPAGIR